MSDLVERLAPCPFCGEVLRKVESWAKSFQPARLYHEYHHPDNGCVTVTGHPALFWAGPATDAPTFITAWNRRSDATITALREEVEEREQRIVERETGRVLRILADEKVKWNDASFETKRLVQSTITEIAATIAASMPVGHSRRRRPRPRQ